MENFDLFGVPPYIRKIIDENDFFSYCTFNDNEPIIQKINIKKAELIEIIKMKKPYKFKVIATSRPVEETLSYLNNRDNDVFITYEIKDLFLTKFDCVMDVTNDFLNL